jgi:hypothetical protein
MRCPKTGKVAHRSRYNAMRHASSLSAKGKGLVFAYPCPHCNFWHVGHTNAEQFRKLLNRIKTRKTKS